METSYYEGYDEQQIEIGLDSAIQKMALLYPNYVRPFEPGSIAYQAIVRNIKDAAAGTQFRNRRDELFRAYGFELMALYLLESEYRGDLNFTGDLTLRFNSIWQKLKELGDLLFGP